MSTVMSAQEAARDFFKGKVSYWKILELAKRGEIPHSRIGSRVLFRRESLEAWMAEQEKNSSRLVMDGSKPAHPLL